MGRHHRSPDRRLGWAALILVFVAGAFVGMLSGDAPRPAVPAHAVVHAPVAAPAPVLAQPRPVQSHAAPAPVQRAHRAVSHVRHVVVRHSVVHHAVVHHHRSPVRHRYRHRHRHHWEHRCRHHR
jgi:hypothetical protein